MNKISKIMEEFFNEAKYTKATLKKDIANGKIEGYIAINSDGKPVDKTFLPVKLSDKSFLSVEDGVLYLSTLIMERGKIVTASDASGKTFNLVGGGDDHVTLRKID